MALVNYERDGQIVTLTLNRPEKLNAFSDELVGLLRPRIVLLVGLIAIALAAPVRRRLRVGH